MQTANFEINLTSICPQAHSLYSSCYARDEDLRWKREAFAVQRLYWGEGTHLSYSEQCDVTGRLKMALGSVRHRVKLGLSLIEPQVEQLNFEPEDIRSEKYNQFTNRWITDIKCLSSTCNRDMIDFTSTVIEEAVKICGHPPCEFACI